MSVVAVVGAQWGDEGKGRIVDYLASNAGHNGNPVDMVIRFQGGDNAGHTVINALGEFKLHLVPSGVFSSTTVCMVGTGCVVNPETLAHEMDELESAGLRLDNLVISNRAHLTMPYHRYLDELEEASRGDSAIGTTKRGIGPTYSDKAARWGLRVGDLVAADQLERKLAAAVARKNHYIETLGGAALVLDEILADCRRWAERLRPHIVDSYPIVRRAIEEKQVVLLEGQLGIMRDVDWGVYPYVTSSNPIASYGPVGAGIPVQAVTEVIGVVKTYVTAVGAGPLPTELHDDIGQQLRDVGKEYGATTGRPRRCGWLDAVALDYARWLNGFTSIAITKLDVLDTLDEIKICIGYHLPSGETIDYVPDPNAMETVDAIYESWPGWRESTSGERAWEDLPPNARRYLRRIEELTGAPIGWISVGPERDEIIKMPDQGS